MNGIATFRLCTLKHKELIKKIDKSTDNMFVSGKLPNRFIPARPNEDYDLIVGEMIYRFDEMLNMLDFANKELSDLYQTFGTSTAATSLKIAEFLNNR